MIRILHFASVINRYDFIDTVLTSLDHSHYDVSALTVTAPKNREGAYSESERYHTKCLNIDFSRRNYRKIFSALREEVRRFRPHILQTHHFDESAMGAIIAKTAKIPGFVIGRHYSDQIYVLLQGFKRSFYLQIEKLCNNAADRIVVPTQEVADLLLKQGVQKEKIFRIPYGTDLGMLESMSPEAVKKIQREYQFEGKFTALTCCRLNKEKGLDYLLEAIPLIKKRFPFFQLVMVGEGPYENKLREIHKELALGDSVRFVGWRKDALNWYSACDVVIQPSLSESFCQVLTESLSLKKPVIMTPVGVAPEVIVNGERGGCLVPIGDSRSIAEAICSLIENPDYRQKLAEKGYEYVRENMTVELTAKKYENLYAGLMEEKGVKVR